MLHPRKEARVRRQEAEYRRSTGHDIPFSDRGHSLGQVRASQGHIRVHNGVWGSEGM